MRNFLLKSVIIGLGLAQSDETLQACGDAFFLPSKYTCYDFNFLCPIMDGVSTLRCGPDCYLNTLYSCTAGKLKALTNGSTLPSSSSSSIPEAACTTEPLAFQINASPYSNYFYSDCHSSSQVVVTSPESESNLSIIGPRIIVAWPAGNSGILAFFSPENGLNGTLGIRAVNSSSESPLTPIYDAHDEGSNATIGVSFEVEFNSSAVLSVSVLGSIRTIRDFTEGPSLLRDEIQRGIEYKEIENGVELTRLWLDNITTTTLSFSGVAPNSIQLDDTQNATVRFAAGTYMLNASFNYPQLVAYSSEKVLNSESSDIITKSQQQTDSLAFLSYTTKLTAGAWRFLTYFGRDSMIAALLLGPVLSAGEGGALEAVLAGVLERVNKTDGSVCHEETIGDYATWLNLENNLTSTSPLCDYKMIDTDDFLPVLLDHYLLRNEVGKTRVEDFLGTLATILPTNLNLTYRELAQISASKIVTITAPFAADGNQTKQNLIRIHANEQVGQWRDSTYGIGGGRIPFDVNTALVPAALRSIAALSRAGILEFNATEVDAAAQIWEDDTLQFFEISIPQSEAKALVASYADGVKIPSQEALLDTVDLNFYAIALDGNNNLSQVAVMHTDDCFRHFLLNTTNQAQLTAFVNSTADNVRRRFPAGLMTDVSMLVANPAFGDDAIYAENFTTSAYHGTVVWSWQLAMMARGLELQLSRCGSSNVSKPEFCAEESVYNNVRGAYNILWDSLDANKEHLSTEVWSWTFKSTDNGRDGEFKYIDLGQLPPPPGNSPTESNAVQLWSLTFLAVTRATAFR